MPKRPGITGSKDGKLCSLLLTFLPERGFWFIFPQLTFALSGTVPGPSGPQMGGMWWHRAAVTGPWCVLRGTLRETALFSRSVIMPRTCVLCMFALWELMEPSCYLRAIYPSPWPPSLSPPWVSAFSSFLPSFLPSVFMSFFLSKILFIYLFLQR